MPSPFMIASKPFSGPGMRALPCANALNSHEKQITNAANNLKTREQCGEEHRKGITLRRGSALLGEEVIGFTWDINTRRRTYELLSAARTVGHRGIRCEHSTGFFSTLAIFPSQRLLVSMLCQERDLAAG